MHSVLDPEHIVFDTALKESLKHTAAVARLVAVFREDGRGELLLVADEDNFFGLVLEGDQVGQFDGLAGFVDDEVLEIAQREVVKHFTG